MFVFSNLATSLDGKIATADRGFFPLGSPYDREHMIELRKEADAVLMGASTLRSFKKPCLAGDSPAPINVVVSNTFRGISPEWPFFKRAGVRRILFAGPDAPRARLKRFSSRSEIVSLAKASKKNPAALQIIHALATQGVKRLLVEGGGSVMWDFVSENLIDEYHVTLTPRLVGGAAAPTLVDGKGFVPGSVRTLRLAQCRVVGDELYLVYRKTNQCG